MSSKIDSGIIDVLSETLREGSNPRHQVSLRSAMDLGPDWDLDVWVYHVRKLTDQGSINLGDVPAYTSLNLRLTWAAAPGIELSVAATICLNSVIWNSSAKSFSTRLKSIAR